MRVAILSLVIFISTSLPAFAVCKKADICAMLGKLNHFAILDKCPNAGPMLAECKKVSEKAIENLPDAKFVDNEDGTVTDTVNKLLWAKSGLREKKVNLKDAKSIAMNAKVANKTGWRLPTLPELKTLVYKERVLNASGKKAWINPIFEDGLGHYYWTTTTCDKVSVIEDRFQKKICQAGENAAWLVHFNINAVFWFHTNLEKPYIWPVQNLE